MLAQLACVIMYLDNMLLMGQSKDKLERQLGQITSLMKGLDFVGVGKKLNGFADFRILKSSVELPGIVIIMLYLG